MKNDDNYADVSSNPAWKKCFSTHKKKKRKRENRLSFFLHFPFKMFLILLLIVPFCTSSHFSLFKGFAPVEQHVHANQGEEQKVTSEK